MVAIAIFVLWFIIFLNLLLQIVLLTKIIKMKKYFISLTFTFLCLTVFAQKQIVWFDAGFKVQYGATGFYNSAIGNSNIYDYTIETGYGYGGKLGINFGYNGLAIDVMRNNAKQTFQVAGSDNVTINWQTTDIYALFRNAKNLGYFEIGPKLSLIKKVEDNLEGATNDRTPDYNDNVIAGVIGFGANIMGNDGRFSGILGLRFEYGFTDFVSDQGAASTVNAPLRDAAVYADGYKNSNLAFAGVVFELTW